VAIRLGLAEICFTTHWDTSPEGGTDDNVIRVDGKLLPTVPDNLARYVADVRQAHETYYPIGLTVRLGLEYGWYPGCEESIEALKSRYDFDHFLCGIHELDGHCFSCEKCYKKCFADMSVESLVDKYVAAIVEAAESKLFHCIAHLDYIRKYGEAHYGPRLNELLLEKLSEKAFPALATSGTAIEVNTSAIRRKFDDYFPTVKIINSARRAGVDVRFLGSDAHAPEQVGYDFDTAAALVSDWSQACTED
jgi:histidinol-phosphatase (PHP family)